MMKSGLGQNEKLKALRIVIHNHDEGEINRITQLNAAIEKKLKDFKDWGLEPPDKVDSWMKDLSKPIISEEARSSYKRLDCVLSLRVASRYSGAQRFFLKR